jgi:hypothetical protein
MDLPRNEPHDTILSSISIDLWSYAYEEARIDHKSFGLVKAQRKRHRQIASRSLDIWANTLS